MRILKGIFFTIILVLVLEFGLRRIGIYKTYAEKNFNRYDLAYDQTWPINYFQQRIDSIHYNQNEFNFKCSFNELGLREDLNPNSLNPEDYLVLFLGDSFTEGVGASCNKEMPAVFEARSPSFIKTYNAGVVGSDPFFSLLWYDEFLSELPSNEVVLIVNYSDISDYIFRGGEERFDHDLGQAQFRKAPKISIIYKHSHLVRFVLHFIFRYDFTLLNRHALEKASGDAIVAISDKINSWKTDHPNVNLTLVIHPYPFAQFRKVPGHDKLPELLPLVNEEITCINLYPALQDKFAQSNYLDYSWKNDGHFNDKGYEIFAEELLQAWMLTKDFEN